jgi:hypothetical protein
MIAVFVLHNVYEVGPLSSMAIPATTRIVLLILYRHAYVPHLVNLCLLLCNLSLARLLCRRATGFAKFLGILLLQQLILMSVAAAAAAEVAKPYETLMTDVDKRPLGLIVSGLSGWGAFFVLGVWLAIWVLGVTRSRL